MTHFPSSLWPCHLAILSLRLQLSGHFCPYLKTTHRMHSLDSSLVTLEALYQSWWVSLQLGEEAHHRISALHCLRLLRDMGTLPAHERLMQQSTIVRGIKPALDDSRKAVRIAANNL